MYMAIIRGWTEVAAFSEDAEKAKKLAIKKKKSFAKEELDKWTWERVEEYFGAYVTEIKEELVLTDI